MKFDELLRRWKQRRWGELGPASALKVEPMYRRWREFFGSMELEEITPAHVEGYRLVRDNGSRGPSILNAERTEIRQIFAFAVALRACAETPVTTWGRKRETVQREYVVLSPEEQKALCVELQDGEVRRFVKFAVATGLRQATIRAATWGWLKQDVDRGTVRLEVPAAHMKGGKGLSIPLTGAARAAIRRDGNMLDFQKLIEIPKEGRVRRLITEAARAAGLPAYLTPHDFRRTWVVRMRDAGADLYDVMRLGGWTNPTVMLKHYFGAVPSKREAEILSKVVQV